MSPTSKTAITSEYTAMIPAITMGMRDCAKLVSQLKSIHLFQCYARPQRGSGNLYGPFFHQRRTFIIKSGLNVPTPAMPIPAFAVPYAAPAHPNIIFKTCQQLQP